jgi:hypothetical protein
MLRLKAGAACLAAVTAMTCLSGAASAQPLDADAGITEEEFRQAIAKRDAIIINLERRLRVLERRIAGEDGSAHSSSTEPERSAIAQASPPAAQSIPQSDEPGRVVVDEVAAERALERSLVETGALLLSRGQFEISPGFSFQRAAVVNATTTSIGGDTFVADRSLKLSRYQANLSLRYGLPWQSQIEVYVPYRIVRRKETTQVLGAIVSSSGRSSGAIGDLRIGIAKTLLRSDRGRTGLIGRLTWDSANGKRSRDGVPLGFGFNELEGGLTAVYRLDPLVFVGTAGYRYTFEDGGIRPGDEYLFSLGTNLAVSPEASLSLFLNQVRRNAFSVGGRKVDGSSQLASSLSFGTSVTVAPRTLFQLTASVGLTDDAPDYGLAVSLPIRF